MLRAYGPLVGGVVDTDAPWRRPPSPSACGGRGPPSGAGTALPAAVPLRLRRPYARRMCLRLDVALHTAFGRLLDRWAAPVDEPDAEERELLLR